MARTVVRRQAQRRWALVALLAAVAVATPSVIAALPRAHATVNPVALREAVLRSANVPYQGYVVSTGSMGVPALPRLDDVASLLSGTTRTRIWYRNPSSYRYAVLTLAGERDQYRSALGETTWDYGANMATEVIGTAPLRAPRAGDLLPPDLARRIVAATAGDPMSALAARMVAGVDAAGLRITPADPATTIGTVDLWADPATGLPVRVEVTARGGRSPVLVSQFDELAQTMPDSSVVRPRHSPATGFTVLPAPDLADVLGAFARFPQRLTLAGRQLQNPQLGGVHGVGLYGTGLSVFIAARVPRDLGHDALDSATKAGAGTVQLPNGAAAALRIPPLTLLVAHTSNFRRYYLLSGFVTTSVLQQAAGELTNAPQLVRGGR